MPRRLAPAILLVAVLAPASAYAQINIDEGKTPAHIFGSDCAVCHKSMRGLANGRDRSALTDFLTEHYTSSRDEAAALAAYVLSGGGGGKPEPEHRTARVEEPRGTVRRPKRPPSPEGEAAPTVEVKRPGSEQDKPAVEPRPAEEHGSPAGRPGRETATRERPRRPEPATPEHPPASVTASPPAAALPGLEFAPPVTANAGDNPTAEHPLIPRDNVPD